MRFSLPAAVAAEWGWFTGTPAHWLVPRQDGGDLVVSEETRQWGTDYDPTRDFGRTAVRRRDHSEHLESLVITLEPDQPDAGEWQIPSGRLRIAWGTAEYETDWVMLWP